MKVEGVFIYSCQIKIQSMQMIKENLPNVEIFCVIHKCPLGKWQNPVCLIPSMKLMLLFMYLLSDKDDSGNVIDIAEELTLTHIQETSEAFGKIWKSQQGTKVDRSVGRIYRGKVELG